MKLNVHLRSALQLDCAGCCKPLACTEAPPIVETLDPSQPREVYCDTGCYVDAQFGPLVLRDATDRESLARLARSVRLMGFAQAAEVLDTGDVRGGLARMLQHAAVLQTMLDRGPFVHAERWAKAPAQLITMVQGFVLLLDRDYHAFLDLLGCPRMEVE